MINNITELLEKFDKIKFDAYESKEFTKGDWTLRYNLIMSEMLGLQVLFNLYYRQRCVQSWGCVDGDNLAAVKWIKRTQRDIENTYWNLEKNAEMIGKELFQQL
jgi:hypothetical protein